MDNQKEYIEIVLGTLQELQEQFKTKNAQYGADDDPLIIFRTGTQMDGHPGNYPWMFKESFGYERKHLAHVAAHGINGDKVDESLKDIIIYSAIQLYMWRKWRGENNK